MGLDGLEVYHYRLNKAQREYFQRLADEFNLVTSGGSDLHGWYEGVDRIGQQPVTEAMVQAMRERAARYAKHQA